MPQGRVLDDYLSIVTGRRRGQGWIEVRFRHAGGMRARFYPADRPPGSIVQTITRLGAKRDVYVGCALRTGQRGDRAHVGEAWCLWAECDRPDSRARLDAFSPVPSLLVASGTPGHVHAYWALVEPIDADTLEEANRQVAGAVGGDPVCYDAARILRPPGTHNYKHTPPAPVAQLGTLLRRPYRLEEILGNLTAARSTTTVGDQRPLSEDPLLAIDPTRYVPLLTGRTLRRDRKVTCPFHALSVGRRDGARVAPARSVDDASLTDRSDRLLLVPPPVYFERLTGLRVGRSGKLHCLFHDDRSPSLQVYREPERGWFCFGCRRGGSVYDLGALLFALGTRGRDFVELRHTLEQRLL